MKRKTILLAGKTIVVSLPNKWVKEWGIQKGDELELVEEGPTIKVRTDKDKKISTAQIDISEKPERIIRWELSALHKKGHDRIEIQHNGHEDIIKTMLKEVLIGFEIIEKTPQRIIIQSISKDNKETYEQVLRRAFLVTLDLAESLPKYLESGEDATELLELEIANNKLTNFCQRLLNKYGHEDPLKTTFMYTILWNLEKVADDYKQLIRETDGKETRKETIDLLIETGQTLRKYYETFYKYRAVDLRKQAEEAKELKTRIRQAMKQDTTLLHAHNIVQKIIDFAGSTIAVHSDN